MLTVICIDFLEKSENNIIYIKHSVILYSFFVFCLFRAFSYVFARRSWSSLTRIFLRGAQQNEKPLLKREEQKEPPSSEARGMFLLKEETDPLMLSPANKGSDHSQNKTLPLSFDGT